MPFLTKVGSAAARAYGLLSAAVAAVPDVYFYLVSMLLPGTGTNGAQNNTFLDSSSNNFTVTRNGNTTQGTFSPFSQTGWSNYFDGAGDYLNITVSMSITGDFTWESWGYDTGVNGFGTLMGWRVGTPWTGFLIQRINATNVQCDISQTSLVLTQTSGTYAKNAWVHVALVRSGSTITLYVNGTSVASGTLAGTITTGTAYWIGSDNLNNVTAAQYSGWISNQRFVNGTAVYTANFTPPTAPLTAITNTSLLTCQNATFIDNSTNAFALTVNGNTRPRTLNPFGYTTTQPVAWSASLNGGAGYFDGTGDSLTVAGNVALAFGTGDFTVEFWVYINSGTSAGFWDTRNTAIQVTPLIYYDASVLRYYVNGVSVISGGALTASAWAHIALTRASGTTRLFVNGSQVGSSYADTNNYTVTNTNYIGNTFTSGLGLAGSISDFRVVKGTAVYTANFTPPTAPLTAITNTSLLLNYTNAGIYDAASQNALETVGNAQISTAQSKWGGGSMYFDGTGDYLIPSNILPLTLGTGDFTIEFWVYFTVGTTASRGLIDWRPASTEGVYPAILTNASSAIIFYVSSATRITGGTLSAATWTHIAVCRSVTSTRLFINGTQSGSTYTDSNNYLGPALRPMIGATGFSSGGSAFDGYMDDLRITRFARYTANFTPPAAAFSLR